MAEQKGERKKLHDRYQRAQDDCRKRGCEKSFAEFEKACSTSVAVFNCPTQKLFREIANGTDLFETYHDLERLRLRSERPVGHDWQKLRPQAEVELLGSHQHLDKLHYAALSLDGAGLDSYGGCTVVLRDEMISHRASCFEGNSALIYEKVRDFTGVIRSTWGERQTLCAAKVANKLDDAVPAGRFPGMLLTAGISQDDDEFVEVHVFGTITAQTFQSVSVNAASHSRQEKILWKAVKEKLDKHGVVAIDR
ncbi:MAG: hypothetical protein HYV60_25270 [Planctomycetia bacterium]|nr:hypothetical protein [Planctomycetia bacterium]